MWIGQGVFIKAGVTIGGDEEKLAKGELKEYAPAKITPEDLFKLFEPVPQVAE